MSLLAYAQNHKRKLGQRLLKSPFHPLYLRLYGTPEPVRKYQAWLAGNVTNAAAAPPKALAYRPQLSLLMAVRNSQREWLEAAVDSVRRQSYSEWQLAICDDASEDAWILPWLRRQSEDDARVVSIAAPRRLGISGTLNLARTLATGEYLGVLDHDDFLSPDALERVAEALQDGGADLLYSDEEYVDANGAPLRPIFKPDWSPELLVNSMYLGHLVMVARDRFEAVGGFDSECDGAQDYDLALRLTDQPARVIHVAQVLYHWRQHPQSTALAPDAKPYSLGAARRALARAVQRRRWDACITFDDNSKLHKIHHHPQRQDPVTVVLLSRRTGDPAVASRRLRRKTTYPQVEWIVVSADGRTDFHNSPPIRQICCPKGTDDVSMACLGARAARTEYLLFLREGIEPLDSMWLTRLIAQVDRPTVGVAGARLLRSDGSIEHAGIAVGIMDGAGNPGRRFYGSEFWPWLACTRDVTAVSGACLAIRRRVYEDAGGFDPAMGTYSDVDLCLRLRRQNYAVILDQSAVLRYRRGALSLQPATGSGRELFRQRWAALLQRTDPYYSPHLSVDREDNSLRYRR